MCIFLVVMSKLSICILVVINTILLSYLLWKVSVIFTLNILKKKKKNILKLTYN